MQVLDSHSNPSSNLGQSFNLEHQVFDRLLKIAQSVDPHKILALAVQLLRTDLGVDRVVIYQRQNCGRSVIAAESVQSDWQNSLGMAVADLGDLQNLADGASGLHPQAIDDVLEAIFVDRYRDHLAQQQVRSSLTIPLIIEDQLWGAIVAHACAHRRRWDAMEMEYCQRLASHVAIALQHALHIQKQDRIIHDLKQAEHALQDKAFQLKSLATQQSLCALQANTQLKNKILQLEETNDFLERQTTTAKILADFILKVRRSLDLDQILSTTALEIHRCLQVDRLAICQIDENNRGTIVAESVVSPWPSALGIKFSPAMFSVQCQKELCQTPYKAISDVEAAYCTAPQMLEMLEVWSVKAKVVVPILQGSKLWGFIFAHQCTNVRYWLPAELELLTQVAAHVSISITQAELYQQRQQELVVMAKAEQMLVVQHEQIGHVLGSSPGILYTSLAQGPYQRIFFGTNLYALLGYTSLDAIETDFWLNCIHPEDRPSVSLLSDCPVLSQEYRFRHKDGTYRWLYDQQKVVYDESGTPIEWIGYCVDITDRRQIEDQLKASLTQKEVLLQEIHHRVKNNLNVIISLLSLQSNYLTDDAVINMFVDSQSRIYTMALIHEHLYGSKNLARLDFAEYVSALVNHLKMSCQPSTGSQVEVCIDISPTTFNIETATPCGLIINELVTNGFKHAFVDGRAGTITISLNPQGNEFQLIVRDDGVGFAPDIDWQNSPSLGLRLVRILARQLEARVTQTSGETGTYFSLVLSELAYTERV